MGGHEVDVYTCVDTSFEECEAGYMRVAGMRELRSNSANLLGGDEPLIVTKHGRVSGLYLPLDDPDRLPLDMRKELSAVLGRHLDLLLKAQGVSENAVAEDFRAHRRSRR